jgi:hypothetical protein
MAEAVDEGLDPYVLAESGAKRLPALSSPHETRSLVGLGRNAEGMAQMSPQILPCRIDACGAAVPRRYP